MRKIMTLVNIEINRIFKFLVGILGLYTVVQTIFTIVLINSAKSSLIENAKQSQLTLEQFIDSIKFPPYNISHFIQNQYSMIGGAVVCILILIYGFIIWYREWFGNNRVIYTLLILPINRMKIYISKFVTMLLLIFSMLSTFIITQAINYNLTINMLPYYNKLDIGCISDIYDNKFLSFIPINTLDLVIYVSEIFVVIALIFLFVHLEISYKIKGAVLGIILSVVYVGILYLLLINSNILIKEKILLITLYNIITICIAGTFSRFLLKNKIRV